MRNPDDPAAPSGKSVPDPDDDDSIDDTQLQEYKEELNSLQGFPDKVCINLLSMVAEDYSDHEGSAKKIYKAICDRLLTCESPSYVLPVMYVLDSILKNNNPKQQPQIFRTLVEQDAADWMPKLHRRLDANQKQKLQKVWKTWYNDTFRLFEETTWKTMGQCFTASPAETTATSVSGIARTKDGSLILASSLRKEMQNILDDMQHDISNELDKVSLERLAEINPDLLSKIKKAAQESLHPENSLFSDSNKDSNSSKDQSKGDWSNVKLDVGGIAESLRSLATQHLDDVYTQTEALQMINYLAASQVVLQYVERVNASSVELEEDQANLVKKTSSASRVVDPSTLTNEGIKVHNDAVISLLYEIGLPYVSQSDARRFRTQLELSHHLDALFRKKQVAKTMVATQERGWYASDLIWCKDLVNEPLFKLSTTTSQNDANPKLLSSISGEKTTYPVDETRDHCVVCGNLFKIRMDHDQDEYVYENCREITVLNDDAAATDSSDQLVHVTCWKGLGSPVELTFDQTVVQDVSERYL